MIQTVAGDRVTSTRFRFNPASCALTRLQISSVGFLRRETSYQMVRQPSLVSTWIRTVCISVSNQGIEIQVVDTLNATVVSIKPVVKAFGVRGRRMTRIVNSSDAHNEAIFCFIVDKRCIVNDAHIVISLETINRTGRKVMSIQLTAEIDFGFPTLAKQSGVVFHTAKIHDLAGFGGISGQPEDCHTSIKPSPALD